MASTCSFGSTGARPGSTTRLVLCANTRSDAHTPGDRSLRPVDGETHIVVHDVEGTGCDGRCGLADLAERRRVERRERLAAGATELDRQGRRRGRAATACPSVQADQHLVASAVDGDRGDGRTERLRIRWCARAPTSSGGARRRPPMATTVRPSGVTATRWIPGPMPTMLRRSRREIVTADTAVRRRPRRQDPRPRPPRRPGAVSGAGGQRPAELPGVRHSGYGVSRHRKPPRRGCQTARGPGRGRALVPGKQPPLAMHPRRLRTAGAFLPPPRGP